MERVNDGVYRIGGYSNAYLIDGDMGVTLVDTGMPKNLDAITSQLVEIGRSLVDITTVVITHGHVDHYGSAAAVVRESNARVVVSVGDSAVVRGETEPTYPPFMEKFSFLKPVLNLAPKPEGVHVDEEVTGNDRLGLVSDLSAVQTPGHTPGHMSLLLDRNGGILFVGDAALSDKSGAVKRGFMNIAEPTFDSSLRRIAKLEFETAYFGHSRPIRSDAAGAFRRFVDAL